MIKPIRLLVVDDSAFMRKAIGRMVEDDPEIEICGTARNGQEAVEKVEKLFPDLVTLDIEMPVMDGLTALRHIMKKHPVPVIMFSTLTTDGAEATLEALQLGAVDFIPKNLPALMTGGANVRQMFLQKIKLIARTKLGRESARPDARRPRQSTSASSAGKRDIFAEKDIVLIGCSTGGPQTLHKIIPQIPAGFELPVIVVQHMPETFTATLARRLDSGSVLRVREVENGERIQPGMVYIAPGGHHLVLQRRGSYVIARVDDRVTNSVYKPSVNAAASSVAKIFGGRSVGILLTGMGNDGLEGFREIKAAGGYIVAQHRSSCVIYGMPRAVVEAGIADAVLPTEAIADLFRKTRRQAKDLSMAARAEGN